MMENRLTRQDAACGAIGRITQVFARTTHIVHIRQN